MSAKKSNHRYRTKQLTLNQYQRRAASTDERKRLAIALHGLAGEIGSVMSIFKKRLRYGGPYEGFKGELEEELGDVLWYLSNLAFLTGIKLNDIGKNNLKKAQTYFVLGKWRRYDSKFPAHERFPAKLKFSFAEQKLGKNKRVRVQVSMNDVIVGDTLTDNSYDPDGYRFHDVFHLAYAAVLGWSPVIRAMLKRKRKSDSRYDEIEDGARAAVIEEAISIFVFNYAKSRDFFKGMDALDFSLLQTVQQLAGELEVKSRSAKQWEKAILEGYSAFRDLLERRRGVVIADMNTHRIYMEKTGA